jgi:hypothetical protein
MSSVDFLYSGHMFPPFGCNGSFLANLLREVEDGQSPKIRGWSGTDRPDQIETFLGGIYKT